MNIYVMALLQLIIMERLLNIRFHLHFPDGTAIKLWFTENIVTGYVVSCENFTILIRTMEYIGETIESVKFTSEQWHLLEALMERLSEMNPNTDSLAYQVACNGRQQVKRWQRMH